MNAFAELELPWRIDRQDYAAPEPGTGLSAHFTLTGRLGKGVKGFASYNFRPNVTASQSSDDFVHLEFNPARVDYKYFAEVVVPSCIRSLSPYLVTVLDAQFTYVDHERTRGINRRMKVARICPICFFDVELCQNAFRRTPEEVAALAQGHAENIELFQEGVLIRASTLPVSVERAEAINAELMTALAVG